MRRSRTRNNSWRGWLSTACLLLPLLSSSSQQSRVLFGADVLLADSLHLLRGRRAGLVLNQASLLTTGTRLLDTLLTIPGVRIAGLFAPEHGLQGREAAGVRVAGSRDSVSRLPVYSLYGKSRKPEPGVVEGLDLIVYDLQDVGARFYTYISTLYFCMQAAAERGIPLVVLDRPDPITGRFVEGPVLDTALRSFVGMVPIPVRYGLTPGELARMINGEGWLEGGRRCRLIVVPMLHWTRDLWYDRVAVPWIPPSPNMMRLETAVVYPGMCLFEGSNISEGRGTNRPFEQIGAPFMDGATLARELNALGLPGAVFEPVTFTPRAIPRVAPSPRFSGRLCRGVSIRVTDRDRFEPVSTALQMIAILLRRCSGEFRLTPQFDILSGQRDLRTRLEQGTSVERILAEWRAGMRSFAEARKKYLLYP